MKRAEIPLFSFIRKVISLELTPRLQAVANQVPQGAVFADIGTDHAYLPVWLLLNGRIDRAIAADLREGPLARARETAAQYGVTDKVSFRLCDGLNGIRAGEANVIAIAGMGGETIAAILAAAPWTHECTLLLQPMTSFPDLRCWLQQNHFVINEERVVREGNRLYSIWAVTGGEMEELSPAELWVGRQSSDPLRGEYLAMMAEKLERSLRGRRAASVPDEKEIEHLVKLLAEIRQMQEELKA